MIEDTFEYQTDLEREMLDMFDNLFCEEGVNGTSAYSITIKGKEHTFYPMKLKKDCKREDLREFLLIAMQRAYDQGGEDKEAEIEYDNEFFYKN